MLGSVYMGIIENCIGVFTGWLDKSKIDKCKYNKDKIGKWEIIDFINDRDVSSCYGYDITPK